VTGEELTSLIVGRLREIPQNAHYEMLASYGLAHQFITTMIEHGIPVARSGKVWYVGNGHNTFFPVHVRSNLQPGIFILRPKEVKQMAKKKKKKKDTDDTGGGY
jgi:hypothetical protein